MNPIHPGGIIKRRFLVPLDISAQELAKAMNVSPSSVSRILSEKAAITSDMSVRLSHAFGTSPELWLNMQSSYDLSISMASVNRDELVKLY
jgi:antitoxin HigA-1